MPRTNPLSMLLVFVLALMTVAGLALGGKSTGRLPAWAEVPLATAGATGIYGDGLDRDEDGQPDIYEPEDGVYFNVGNDGTGSFYLAPKTPRGLRILLPPAALSQIGAAPFDPTGDWIWLYIPGLYQATKPAVLGETPCSGSSRCVFLYFRVDSNRDNKLSQADEQYNLRWHNGITLVSVNTAGGRVVYTLETTPGQSTAELILRTNRGEISKGFYSMPLSLRVERNP